MGLVLCILAFAAAYLFARRSLAQGVVALLAVGYAYGILRANYPDGQSHFMFDAALIGLYLAHFARRVDPVRQRRSADAAFWMWVLAAPAFVMFLVPLQHPLVQLIGLRAGVLFLPLLVVGARLDGDDLATIGRGLVVLTLIALGVAIAEYFLGVATFFPRNAVTRIMFDSSDVGRAGQLRIPSTFSSAHAYGGTMVASLPLLAAYWVARRSRPGRLLGALALVAAVFGVFLCAARLPVVILALLFVAALAGGGLSTGRKIALVAGACAVLLVVLGNERLQRFRTLENTGLVVARFEGSTNERLIEIAERYPLGAGLARAAGTSIPFFLSHLAKPQIGLENEFSRIIIEEGILALALWLVFVLWATLRRPPPGALAPFGARLVRSGVAISWATGLIGTGLLTAIPGTALMVLQMGLLCASDERRDAAAVGAGTPEGDALA